MVACRSNFDIQDVEYELRWKNCWPERRIAWLAWLIHDPTAPPRQHIKQIFFRHDGHLDEKELHWHGPDEASESATWMVEQLTVRYPDDAQRLHSAGLRPQRTFCIGSTMQVTNVILRPLVRMIPAALRKSSSHSHIWNKKSDQPETTEDGQSARIINQRSHIRFEISSTTAGRIQMKDIGRVLTIQLDDGDYLQQNPEPLREAVAAALEQGPDVQVVLACKSSYRIAGQTVAEFIRGLSTEPVGVSAHAVECRVRLSEAAWVPALGDEDAFCAMAKATRCGGNPWDSGYVV